MTAVICPLYKEAYYTYSIDLSDETYSLTFRWNSRLQQWMMDIDDSEDASVVRGVPLVPVYPLLAQYSLGKPVGQFYLMPVEMTSPEVPIPREIYKSHYLVYDDGL